MNLDYASTAFTVLLLFTLAGILLWSMGFAIYLNRIHSHGWASTRRLLQTLVLAGPICLVISASFWEDCLAPRWLLAHLGQASSQVDMARRFSSGDGLLSRNEILTRVWLMRAARAGNAQAQAILGNLDRNGWGLAKPDLVSALGWARLAAAQGVVTAQLLAAEILRQQPSLAHTGETAQAYFTAALPQLQAQAAAGSAQALFSLGMLKIQGHGVPLDQEGGYIMVLKAKAKGIDPSQSLTLSVLRTKLPADLVHRLEKNQGQTKSH